MDGSAVATRPLCIAVLAMGGQGGGVLVDWIVSAAEHEGWFAQATSVPGVAQRTGATLYYVELLAPPFMGTPVLSLMPAPGQCDLLVGAELMEAGRAMLRGLASPERTLLIASTHRALAVSEKVTPGDGAGDPDSVLDAARSAARRVVAFDMRAMAEQAGSVISAVLFGAIAGANGLPFPRAAFERAVRDTGVGVEPSLRAFAAGFAAAQAPAPERVPGPPAKRFRVLRATGHPALDALAARLQAFPELARPMLAAGLARVVDFQDPAYGAEYLDRVTPFLGTPSLLTEAAKQVASAMAYDDVIRVADLKTRGDRVARIRAEVLARPDQVMATTEYMHPGVAEICGLMPARIGLALERSPRAARALGPLARGRHVRTDTLRWFVPLYLLAGLRRFRRGTLRHAREAAHLETWLAAARDIATRDPALALEVLRARRLVKGYSDTHARGMTRFGTLMDAARQLDGRADAADWMRRLREAALRDASGQALEETWRTVQSFVA